MPKVRLALCLALLVIGLAACNFDVPLVTPTLAPTFTPRDTLLPTASPFLTLTPTLTQTRTYTPLPTETSTRNRDAHPFEYGGTYPHRYGCANGYPDADRDVQPDAYRDSSSFRNQHVDDDTIAHTHPFKYLHAYLHKHANGNPD